MQISDLLAQMDGTRALARDLGISETEAAQGAEALLPAMLGGFQKQQAQAAGGDAGLGGLLQQLGGSGLLDNLLGAQPTDVGQGNNVLGAIFGSRDVSRAVAADAAGRSGLSPELLKKMLPLLAMMVTGYMAKQGAGQQAPAAGGGLGGMLGGLLGGGQAQGAGGGLLGSVLGGMLGGGQSAQAQSANPLDAILKQMGR